MLGAADIDHVKSVELRSTGEVGATRTLAFGVALTVNHDSLPAPGKVPTDTAHALTLDVLL